MFAVQSYNQVIYHLSQLTPFASYHRSNHRVAKKRTSVTTQDSIPASFFELKSQLNFDHDLLHKNSHALSPLCIVAVKKKSRNRWNKSYICSALLTYENNGKQDLQNIPASFFVHKLCGNNHMRNAFHTNFLQLSQSCKFDSQIRTFKTERSIAADYQRSPNLVLRLKKIIPSERNNPFLKEPYGGWGDDNMLKNIERLPEDEGKKIKLAFAEGYAAGQNKVPNKTIRIIKAIQNFLLVALIICSAVFILASASGTVFKLQLGSQVEVDAQDIDITFDDVKGVDEAKQELLEIVEFLKNPEKFSALGGKLPKGVLLVGPPGTGKTLLARAVAGEAGVPFFHAAGSEFDEILVGQGARRVRDLFAAAKNRAPCVIFIDEIDAVGGKRTNSVLHPYANQTINQLLSEMDGFHQNEGVIVLGATNRREDLDRALLRPGRFDVEVHVPVPDFGGRKDIFNLYLNKIKYRDVDVELLARGTTGFTGADIENMVNLAALRAAMDGSKFVSMKDLLDARDKVLMGPQRKARIPDEETNEITAVHEGGHAVVAYFTKDALPVHKVTIMPRGSALGHTAYIPQKESYHTRKSELLATIDSMLGGRAAEELIYGADKVTTGAASDLKQATYLASQMVKDFGMSDKVGLRYYENKDGYLVTVNDHSQTTNELIDSEIKKILNDSYERAKAVLKAHAKEHKQLTDALLKYETLEADDVKAILDPKKEFS